MRFDLFIINTRYVDFYLFWQDFRMTSQRVIGDQSYFHNFDKNSFRNEILTTNILNLILGIWYHIEGVLDPMLNLWRHKDNQYFQILKKKMTVNINLSPQKEILTQFYCFFVAMYFFWNCFVEFSNFLTPFCKYPAKICKVWWSALILPSMYEFRRILAKICPNVRNILCLCNKTLHKKFLLFLIVCQNDVKVKKEKTGTPFNLDVVFACGCF